MGQMNARLSGGERQRIGIARIFLRNPDICLMDEPSSALDALHEKELLHTLQTEYADKTILLISHRSSTNRSPLLKFHIIYRTNLLANAYMRYNYLLHKNCLGDI